MGIKMDNFRRKYQQARAVQKMVRLGEKRFSIRENFEYGRQRAAQSGKENVLDFNLTKRCPKSNKKHRKFTKNISTHY